MTDTDRLLPLVTLEDAHFWRGGADGALRVLRCVACDHYIHPPAPLCPRCHSRDVTAATLSGRGFVTSFTINLQAWRPGMAVPYVVAIVELVEQAALRLTTNIVGCEAGAVRIGLPVRVVFEKIEDVWLPLFEPDPAAVA